MLNSTLSNSDDGILYLTLLCHLGLLTHCGRGRRFASLHYNCARRMTQICVFNTRLVSTHYTLNYAIHGAFLRMVPLTDVYTRVGTIYLQLIQNRYMFRSFTVPQCSHQHCVQPVASDVEVVGYL